MAETPQQATAYASAEFEEWVERHYGSKLVLVTGGLGFIGSHLTGVLAAAGADVLTLDLQSRDARGQDWSEAPGVSVEVADVRDEAVAAQAVADREVVFHLAGHTSHLDSMKAPLVDLDRNCVATLSVLEACRVHNRYARVVYASTRQVYGRPRYLPVDEDHPVDPVDLNGVHKAAAEYYLAVYARAYGVPSTVLRLTNTYGEGMPLDARRTFLGHWVREVVDGRQIEIWGDGTQVRDFTHVDDVVRALLLSAASQETIGQVYNLGGAETRCLRDVAELLIDIHGSGSYRLVRFPGDRQPIDIGDYAADFSKIRSALGWAPTIPLAEGLQRTVRFATEREHP